MTEAGSALGVKPLYGHITYMVISPPLGSV